MTLLNNNLLKRFFSNKLKIPSHDGIVGVSITADNVAMAHVSVTGPKNITVNSYRYIATSNKLEQLEALKEYVYEYQLMDCACSYVLPVDKYVIGIIESPEVSEHEMPEAVRAAVRDFVDYPIEEAVVDMFPLPFKRTDDNKKISYAVVARSPVIYEVMDFIKEAGLKLKYIDIPELCLRNLAMLHAESNKGALLLRLHVNGGQVLLVSEDNIVMTRKMDLPIKDLLEEETNIGLNQPQKNHSFLETLTFDLHRTIDYSNSIFQQVPISCITLTPSELDLNNVNEFLAEHLGMPVHNLNLVDIMRFNKNTTTLEQAKCLLAIGAGLRQIKV